VTDPPTTEEPTTEQPTTEEPTTEAPSGWGPSGWGPGWVTDPPTTEEPTTEEPTTEEPTTEEPTTEAPSGWGPSGWGPGWVTDPPTTEEPTTEQPTTEEPTTESGWGPGWVTEGPGWVAPGWGGGSGWSGNLGECVDSSSCFQRPTTTLAADYNAQIQYMENWLEERLSTVPANDWCRIKKLFIQWMSNKLNLVNPRRKAQKNGQGEEDLAAEVEHELEMMQMG